MVPHQTWPKDAALLALGSIGAITAWAHNRSSLLDFLIARNVVGLSTTARHLRGARDRATLDLSGLLEGLGIISAALLFAGPLEVRPLPATVYALGLVLVVIHVWSAFLQAMTDSTWYAPEAPPGRAVLVLRPLLLLPFTVIYELVLRGARDAASAQARRNRADDAITVHSLVKNAAYALINEVDNDPGAGPETRSLAREMLALTEEARLMVLGRAAELGHVDLLWHCVTRIMPSGGDTTAELDPASRAVELSGTDYQLAGRPPSAARPHRAGRRADNPGDLPGLRAGPMARRAQARLLHAGAGHRADEDMAPARDLPGDGVLDLDLLRRRAAHPGRGRRIRQEGAARGADRDLGGDQRLRPRPS